MTSTDQAGEASRDGRGAGGGGSWSVPAGRSASPSRVARVLGLSLLAMMLSVLARIQLDDDTVATVLGTIGIVGIIATLAVETWAVGWWGSGGEPASTSVEGSGPRG